MTLFASKGRSSEWREIWTGWRYSELAEFVQDKQRSDDEMWDDINGQDIEYAEGYMVTLLARMLGKL